MNENAIHGALKKGENGEFLYAITTHSSKHEGGGHMNENTIHGAPKRLRMKSCTKHHYAWLQTRRWRTHERKCNSWGSEKG